MSKQLLQLSPDIARALNGLALGQSAAPAASFTVEKTPDPIVIAPSLNGPR